jgi:DUF4097 and DUF4098 domain-containing protein YvlB
MRLHAAAVGAVSAIFVMALGGATAGAQGATRAALTMKTTRAYQGRNEQSERFSRRVRIGRDGRVSIGNIAGDIVVTGTSGDEVSIDATKRTRGNRDELSRVEIIVDEHGGRVDVRTNHTGHNDHVSVDYAVSVPDSASVELASVSGSIKVSGVKGSVRATTVSGDVTTNDTPKVEVARSTSGNVTIGHISIDGDLSAGSISGSVTVKGVKARGLDLGSISGDVLVTDATCDRLTAKSVSGGIEYSGSLSHNGRYEMNTHSGSIRLTLPAAPGFDLTATTFSGAIRSAFGMTVGGDSSRDLGRRGLSNRSIHATYGDGSATLTLRTFSGNIVLEKR